MSYTVIIPARYASQRLPGKPLLDIGGQPMIQRVVACAAQSAASRVIVATDDERIAAAVEAFDGEVCLTSADHPSGTDRLEEVVTRLGLPDDAIVVNVQGDEPLMPAAVIDQVAANLAASPNASAATLCEPVASREQLMNPNAVKVVTDTNGHALYFSRAPIPWDRDSYGDAEAAANSLSRRHIGIYAYRVGLLHQFVSWSPSPLEQIEKLEQLRILSQGLKIHVADACEQVPGGVDTEADLNCVRALFQQQV